MENTNPDPPGKGCIVLGVNESGTSVYVTPMMDGHTIAHLFYHAILYNPLCFVAMQKAIAEYSNKNLS